MNRRNKNFGQPGLSAPALPAITDLGGREEYISLSGATTIRCAYFPATGTPAHTIVILPGRTEFIEKYLEIVGELIQRGHDVYVFDWRGQGRSTRPLANPHKGHIDDFGTYTNDFAKLLETTIEPRLRAPITLLAHSTGSLAALLFLSRHPGRAVGAVLVSPMTKIEAGSALKRAIFGPLLPFSKWPPLGTRYLPGFGDYRPGRAFDGNLLSSDETRFRVLDHYIAARPELALGGPTIRWYAASHAAIAEVANWRPDDLFDTSVLFISAIPDQVVGHRTQRALAAKLPNGHFVLIAGARHEIMMEQDCYRDQFWSAFDEFAGS